MTNFEMMDENFKYLFCKHLLLDHIPYGTAGFRCHSRHMFGVVCRAMPLIALRSIFLQKNCGVMITASHNPVDDNGLKIIDPDGSMLKIDWETYFTSLVNVESWNEYEEQWKAICIKLGISSKLGLDGARVLVGIDTRPSSLQLEELILDCSKIHKFSVVRCKLVTTPQLHYAVLKSNVICDADTDYYTFFSQHFNNFMQNMKLPTFSFFLDCANGVGGLQFVEFLQYVKCCPEVTFYNNGEGILNDGCGADFVKIEQAPPRGVEIKRNALYASFDGDADRIVFYCLNESGQFTLLDGDRIACLYCEALRRLLHNSGYRDLNIAVVQTAYANGASTRYLQNKGLNIVCTKTGVKHLHEAASKHKLAVYFEANGHGTVCFQSSFLEELKTKVDSPEATPEHSLLYSFLSLTNSTTGDAMTNFLQVYAALAYLDWTYIDWVKIYKDLPCIQIKVNVPDRALIQTENAERSVVSPKGMQSKIDEIIGSGDNFRRCFVRPSGTENVVRVYAEAATHSEACDLANGVKGVVESILS